jgi:competence protein ComEC
VGNSYGHPHAEALAVLRAVGAKVYRTDTQGTVVVTDDGSAVTVNTLGASRAATTVKSGRAKARAGTAVGAKSRDTTTCAIIGNKRTHVYHLATASHLPKPENQVCFSSRAEAEKAGYRPCKICFP